jgi:hypothetical protein
VRITIWRATMLSWRPVSNFSCLLLEKLFNPFKRSLAELETFRDWNLRRINAEQGYPKR